MALLDHNGVYGSARFHTSAKLNDIRAHVGAEVSVSSLGQRLRPPSGYPISTLPRRFVYLSCASPAKATRIYVSSLHNSKCGRRRNEEGAADLMI